jgi:SLT domain-containing protein
MRQNQTWEIKCANLIGIVVAQFHKIAVGVSYIETPHGSVCAMPLNNIHQRLDTFVL